jgi:hypothetical protein
VGPGKLEGEIAYNYTEVVIVVAVSWYEWGGC